MESRSYTAWSVSGNEAASSDVEEDGQRITKKMRDTPGQPNGRGAVRKVAPEERDWWARRRGQARAETMGSGLIRVGVGVSRGIHLTGRLGSQSLRRDCQQECDPRLTTVWGGPQGVAGAVRDVSWGPKVGVSGWGTRIAGFERWEAMS